ncbi:hypothetical protein [Peribacillus asahii]|uniref:hypothetical protein n=1 Tax=Peribacillus asahii TaxID=228899 RepID=UPI0037F83FE9
MFLTSHICTRTILQKESMLLISKRLGHTKISTTMDIYGHLLPNMQKGASDKLDATLFGSVKAK